RARQRPVAVVREPGALAEEAARVFEDRVGIALLALDVPLRVVEGQPGIAPFLTAPRPRERRALRVARRVGEVEDSLRRDDAVLQPELVALVEDRDARQREDQEERRAVHR